MKYQSSEKKEIKRSEIKLNPYNPKHHTDDAIRMQVKNIKKNGFLGGIVYNKRSGNCIDGHRRLMALDVINKYDGTNDYTVKVEVVDYDEKTELEQMTYMATQNSKADYNLIVPYFDKIDPSSIGLSEEEIKTIEELAADFSEGYMQDLSDSFLKSVYEPSRKEDTMEELMEKREAGKMNKEDSVALKRGIRERMKGKESDIRFHILLEFADEEEHRVFCESLGYQPAKDMVLQGMELLGRL